MSTIASTHSPLLICLGAIVTFVTAPADGGLLLYYDFNDVAVSVTDKSGLGNSGTIIGAATYSAPGTGYNNTPGRAMDFNAPADIIQVDTGATAFDSLATTGAVSIAFWIFGDNLGDPRPGNPNTNFSAFDTGGLRQLMAHVPWQDGIVYFDSAGGFVAGVNRISKDATADQFEGRWNHWIFIKEGSGATGTSSIYVNNTLFHSAPTTGALGDIETFYVGGNGRGTTEGYHGMIDEFAVWDHALTPAERTQVFSGVIPEPTSASLLAAACVGLLLRRRRGR
jgi:hypothetical protein